MLRDIFLGKRRIESQTEIKYALLRAQLGVLLGAICFIYIIIDLLSGVAVYIPWYLAAILFSYLVIHLNRQGKYLISSVILLATANMMVFLIASLEDSQGGAFFYFVATSAISLVVLNPLNKTLGYLFVFVSFALAGIAFFGNGLPIEAPMGGERYEKISFAVNFTLGLASSILVLIFVMRRNQESESTLIRNQEELIDLADELEKSKNLYALALEGTEAGIYEWDIGSNKVTVSLRFKKMLGYSAEDELNLDFEKYKSMIHHDDSNRFVQNINDAVSKGSRYQNEIQIRMKDGSFRWFFDSGIVSMENGVAKLAVGSIIDINNRKMAEQQIIDKNTELEKTNEELDRFVYRASHDMRAPLSTLLGLLNLAKVANKDSQIGEYHELMTNRIHTMDGFIKEVTDYSRNARLEVVSEDVNVASLLEEIKKSFEFLAAEVQVKFEIETDPAIALKVDVRRLKVVLSNIIYNAIKYCDRSKAERFVKISVTKEQQCVCIRVRDNGIGIPKEYQTKIFDMFFRATELSEGSGLGLYIVKETLDRLKGSVSCESEEFKGSMFAVKIPLDHKRNNCTTKEIDQY